MAGRKRTRARPKQKCRLCDDTGWISDRGSDAADDMAEEQGRRFTRPPMRIPGPTRVRCQCKEK